MGWGGVGGGGLGLGWVGWGGGVGVGVGWGWVGGVGLGGFGVVGWGGVGWPMCHVGNTPFCDTKVGHASMTQGFESLSQKLVLFHGPNPAFAQM